MPDEITSELSDSDDGMRSWSLAGRLIGVDFQESLERTALSRVVPDDKPQQNNAAIVVEIGGPHWSVVIVAVARSNAWALHAKVHSEADSIRGSARELWGAENSRGHFRETHTPAAENTCP
jgi:hypothetical protein